MKLTPEQQHRVREHVRYAPCVCRRADAHWLVDDHAYDRRFRGLIIQQVSVNCSGCGMLRTYLVDEVIGVGAVVATDTPEEGS